MAALARIWDSGLAPTHPHGNLRPNSGRPRGPRGERSELPDRISVKRWGQTVSPSATVQAGVGCGFQCAEALFAARLGLCNIGSGHSPIFHLVSNWCQAQYGKIMKKPATLYAMRV